MHHELAKPLTLRRFLAKITMIGQIPSGSVRGPQPANPLAVHIENGSASHNIFLERGSAWS